MSCLVNYVYTFVKGNLKVNCNVNLFTRMVYVTGQSKGASNEDLKK